MVATEVRRHGRFDCRLPVAEREALRQVAEAEGRSSTAVIRELIAQAAQRHEESVARIFGKQPPGEAERT